MENMLLPLLYLTGCLKYALAYRLHTEERSRALLLLPGFLCSIALTMTAGYMRYPMLDARIVIDVLVIFSALLFIKGGVSTRMTVFLILFFSVESLSLFFLILLFGLRIQPLTNAQNLLVDCLAVSALLFYGLIRSGLRRCPKIEAFLKKLLPLFLILEAVVLLFAIQGIIFIATRGGDGQHLLFAYVMSLLGLLSVMGTIWTAVYLFRANKQIVKNAEIEKKCADAQKQYLESLLEREEETRRYRHDMDKHLVCLKSLIEKKSNGEALSYLSQLETKMERVRPKTFHSGNETIDALTGYFAAKLPPDVKVSLTGTLRDAGGLALTDLCTIYANLLSNAVEELDRLDDAKRELSIRLREGRGSCEIVIENTCGSPVSVSTGPLPSRKADPSRHGFGLRNVRECVEKHHGSLDLRSENHIFHAAVRLPLF